MLATISILVTTVGVATAHRVAVGPNPELAFRLESPAGWAMLDVGFPAGDYRYVYAALNSTGDPELRVVAVEETVNVDVVPWQPSFDAAGTPVDSLRRWGSESLGSGEPDGSQRVVIVRSRYSKDRFAKQLPRGAVYLEIAVLHGGPPPPPVGVYAWREQDGPVASIAHLARDREPTWESEDVVVYRADYIRWHRYWQIEIVGRKPFHEESLEEAFRVVESLEYPATPIVDRHQAVEAAIGALPAEMLPLDEWLEGCGLAFNYAVAVDSLENGFNVEFRILDGTDARNVVRTKAYEVRRDGEIVERTR